MTAGFPHPEGVALPEPPAPSDENTLNVALYPFIPNPPKYQATVEQAWAETGSPFKIGWSTYEPYKEPPPETLDLFAFDCMFIDELLAKEKIEPIDISEVDELMDLMEFAVANTAVGETTLGGIPYLGCVSTLFYRATDKELDQPETFSIPGLFGVMKTAQYKTERPQPGEGLMIGLDGKTTDASLYAAAWRSLKNVWWPTPMPMPMPPTVEREILKGFFYLREMAGAAQAKFPDETGLQRVAWMEEGYGRALVGFAESMAFFQPQLLGQIRLRPLPTSVGPSPEATPFYTDAMGLRPNMPAAKRAAALQLANLIASEPVFVAACGTAAEGCQYLTPTRQSSMDTMLASAEVVGKYMELATIIEGSIYEPTPFRLGVGVSQWAPAIGARLINEIFGADAAAEIDARPLLPLGYRETPAGIWRRER
ncbi:MAG TPA: thiamine pyridinylase [Solirubrobacterales bacterium]